LEQPETKDWLQTTKDTLMTDRAGNEADEEGKKLQELIERYDATMPKVNDTKNVVDCLWRAYQFTDEMAPYMEFLEDFRSKSTRDVMTDSAPSTEELTDKHEKCMDQMDKKRKGVLDFTARGEKILADPKSPKFLEGHVGKLKALWVEANEAAETRLKDLKGKWIFCYTLFFPPSPKGATGINNATGKEGQRRRTNRVGKEDWRL